MWTYTTLKTALEEYLEDDSDEFVANQDNIIELAETRCLRDLDLEIFRVTGAITLTASTRTQSKPAGLIKTDSIFLTVGSSLTPILPRSKEFCDMYAPVVATEAQPKFYADLDEDNWYMVPTPNSGYSGTCRFLKRPTGLSSGNTTSWLGDNAGDVLLYACLVEAARFLKNPDKAKNWGEAYRFEKLPQARYELRGQGRNDFGPLRQMPRPKTPEQAGETE